MTTFDEWFDDTLARSGVTRAVTDPALVRKLAVILEPPAATDLPPSAHQE